MARQDTAWVKFGGVANSAISGVHVLEIEQRKRGKERGESLSTPGVSGNPFVPDGVNRAVYDNAARKVTFMLRNADESAFFAWVSGDEKALETSENAGYYQYARAINEVDMQYAAPGVKRATVTFSCRPWLEKVNEADVTLTGSGLVTNAGTIPSCPLITVYGSGSINLIVNGYTVFFDGVVDSVTLDCFSKLAYGPDEETNLNMKTTLLDDWPELRPGSNAVSVTGSVTSIVISPRSRWL